VGLLVGGSAAWFLALHFAVERRSGEPFKSAFRLSRGLASIVLSALGFFSLVHFSAHAGTVYVLPSPDPLALALVALPIGHFVADFILLAYAFLRDRDRPRFDLIVHHGLGLVAAALTLALPIAAPLYLLLFTTEMMPVTTGLSALGTLRGKPSWERLGARLRLAVLLLWRIPLWLWVGHSIARNLLYAHPAHQARVIYEFSASFLLVTLSLDAHWTLQSLRALARQRDQTRGRSPPRIR